TPRAPPGAPPAADPDAGAWLTGNVQFGSGPNGVVRGLSYDNAADTDVGGAFHALAGQTVMFHIGGIILGTHVMSADAPKTVSPYQLAGSAKCEETDTVAKIVAVLEALDADHDPSNGIDLTPQALGASPRSIATMSWDEIGQAIGVPLPAAKDAIAAFI